MEIEISFAMKSLSLAGKSSGQAGAEAFQDFWVTSIRSHKQNNYGKNSIPQGKSGQSWLSAYGWLIIYC